MQKTSGYILIIEDQYTRALQTQKWLLEFGGSFIKKISISYSFKDALNTFNIDHPDLMLISKCDDKAELFSFIESVRLLDADRHTGLMIYYPDEILEDAFVIKCLEVGIDDCLPNYINPEVKIARVKTSLKLKAITDQLRNMNFKLKKMSMTDDLTGLLNMRGFDKKLSKAVQECQQGKASLAVLMMDLDKFKLVNDTMNHLVGSYAISEVGQIILRLIADKELDASQSIIGARYGGDEYIILFKNLSLDICQKFCEQLRETICTKIFGKNFHISLSRNQSQEVRKTFRLTASLGLCWTMKGAQITGEELIKSADALLYKSKKSGRNQTSTVTLLDVKGGTTNNSTVA